MSSDEGRRPNGRDSWEVWRDRLFTIAASTFVAVLIWLDFADDGTIQNQWLFIVLAAFGSGATTWILYNWGGKKRRRDDDDE